MMDDVDERPATSLEALDLHLRYMRRDMKTVLDAIQKMATKSDFESLNIRIQHIEKQMDRQRESPFWKIVSNITKLGAAAAVLVATLGGIATVVHYWDRVDQVAKQAGK